ncbi:MAG: hypothetical protein ABIA12_02665 [Candidatus Aenigmatarchaeota archaeon]
MKSLAHNGVMVTEYQPKGYRIRFRGKELELTAGQEEMAVAWVKKLGTEYVQDPVFESNFFVDFCKALGLGENAAAKDFDFSEIIKAVEKERAAKESMGKEAKKKQAAERKAVREANKEKYGHAVVDGERVELSNYVVEPSSIFMGRGKHPLRGRWKRGATHEDITLNLSPGAPIPCSSIKVNNQQWLEKVINIIPQCKSDDALACLTKLNGRENITSESIGKIEKIQKYMREFLKSTMSGAELIEILEETRGENGLKNLEATLKGTPNTKGRKQNTQESLGQLNLERVLTPLENTKFSKSLEGNVNSVGTAISEFLSSIIEFHLGEKTPRSSTEGMTIGEILEKEKASKYCVATAIGLFTCLDISIESPWKEVVWLKDCMWISRWDDSLRGKEKYVWLSESSPMRQQKEQAKFDRAIELAKVYGKITKHIAANLAAEDDKRRKVATVCYLIDALNLRVGDEKGDDEADTVGATTLTNKNVVVKQGNAVEFDFLGKDSVRMQREAELPPQVVRNLQDFIRDAEERANAGNGGKAMIFEGVRSEAVGAFLDEVAPDVTAKVFRTFHSTEAVRAYLEKNAVKPGDSEDYKKYVAAMANLQAAIACNHKRKLPKNWEESLRKKEESLRKLEAKLEEAKNKAAAKAKADAEKTRRELIASMRKKTPAKPRRAQRDQAKKYKETVERMRLRLKTIKATKDYNLNTSLKNYIDPRVYKRWADSVKFEWTKYYPKTMQKKFSWVERAK